MGVIGNLGPASTPRVMKSSLAEVASANAMRCDAKQSETRFRKFENWIEGVPHFSLGRFLPDPVVKGSQPAYSDGVEGGIPVISTIAIQNLAIDEEACRRVARADYGPRSVRKPSSKDVLVTVDGGTSIGKPVLFDLDGDWAVDSHVALLRPRELDPLLLVYLLASPLGQLQFQKAESGASGQTAVTEDEIRRFRFPNLDQNEAAAAVGEVQAAAREAETLRASALEREADGWSHFMDAYAPDL